MTGRTTGRDRVVESLSSSMMWLVNHSCRIPWTDEYPYRWKKQSHRFDASNINGVLSTLLRKYFRHVSLMPGAKTIQQHIAENSRQENIAIKKATVQMTATCPPQHQSTAAPAYVAPAYVAPVHVTPIHVIPAHATPADMVPLFPLSPIMSRCNLIGEKLRVYYVFMCFGCIKIA